MWRRFLAPGLLVLGVVLLLNPLYAFPAGTAPNYHYEVEQIEADDDLAFGQALSLSDRALLCPGEDRACELEVRVHEDGPVAASDDVVYAGPGAGRAYEVVVVNETFAAPVEESENGTTLLAHEPVDREAALDRAALDTDASEVSDEAVRAIESGSLWANGPVPALSSGAPIAHDGAYYVAETRQYRSDGIDRPIVWAVRIGGFLVGGGMVLLGLWATSAPPGRRRLV